MPHVVGRISFFVNAGVRFIEEIAKMRTFTAMWDEICRTRYGVEDPSLRRFRYGVQVNSLGLTEQQPENNVQRIVLEMLGVTLSADARARALQLPAWNEALGLPRPADQQWSLRMQQVLAYESDLLEYPDIFAGSSVDGGEGPRTDRSVAAQSNSMTCSPSGGAFAADRGTEESTRRQPVPARRANRVRRAGRRRRQPIHRDRGVAPHQRCSDRDDHDRRPSGRTRTHRGRRRVGAARATKEPWSARARRTRARGAQQRPGRQHHGADHRPREGRRHDRRMGERPARGLRGLPGADRCARRGRRTRRPLRDAGRALEGATGRRGRPPKLLVAKPGLDGHSNGAEQIAVAARDAGFEVIYQGIRLSPEEIVAAARDEDVDVIGLSILSGSHLALVPRILECLRAGDLDIKVVVGGIVPDEDAQSLLDLGVVAVYTPKDFSLAAIMSDLLGIVESSQPSRGRRLANGAALNQRPENRQPAPDRPRRRAFSLRSTSSAAATSAANSSGGSSGRGVKP